MEGSWRIALDDDKLGQLVALIAAAVPDVLSVLEKTNTGAGMWFLAIVGNCLFLQTNLH